MRAFLEINRWIPRSDKVGNPVTINPNHILKIQPCFKEARFLEEGDAEPTETVIDPRLCEICLTDGSFIFVEGDMAEVVDRIELAEKCYDDPEWRELRDSLDQIKECLADGFNNLCEGGLS